MSDTLVTIGGRGFGSTMRRDPWWTQPLATFIGLTAFLVYALWAGLQGEHYAHGPYVSPFYSPMLYGDSPHAWFGPRPEWWPSWLLFSPALFILWVPAGFRITCYFFRGAYYKSHWADPPACAVGEPRSSYWGERSFPLILQNVHRYFLYFAVLFVLLHLVDIWHAFEFEDGFGIGVGTVVLLIDVVLIGGYVFGCHSLRHLIGGYLDQLTRRKAQQRLYEGVSCLNRRHPWWGWTSLIWVGFTDLYVRLCAMGVWTDWRIL